MGHMLFMAGVYALLAALATLGLLALVLWYVRETLLGIAVVDADDVDPALKKEIERLELEYAVAEELGYGGDALLGIESQLNRAKLAAAHTVSADATTAIIVSSTIPQDVTFVPAQTIIEGCPLPVVICSLFSPTPCGYHTQITTGWVGAVPLGQTTLITEVR